MHLVTIVHSAVNMQPLNDLLAALDASSKEAKGRNGSDQVGAEALRRKWGNWNVVRVITPTVAGIIAISQFTL